jgi:hypothetical protein
VAWTGAGSKNQFTLKINKAGLLRPCLLHLFLKFSFELPPHLLGRVRRKKKKIAR